MVLSILGYVQHNDLYEVWALSKKDDYVFCSAGGVLDEGVIVTIDVSDFTNPIHAAVFEPGYASKLWGRQDAGIIGDYMWLTSGDTCFTILDISDPLNVSIKGQLCDATLSDVACAYIVGDHAYVASWRPNERLSILDLSDLTAPTIVGTIQDPALECATGICGDSNYAYVTMDVFVDGACKPDQSGLTSVDVSDVNNPFIVDNNIDGLGYSDNLRNQGNYAYLCNHWTTNRLLVYDISDPTSLSVAADLIDPHLAFSYGIYVDGSYAAVYANGYITIVDISNPLAPTIVDYTNVEYEKLDMGRLWVEDGCAFCPSFNYNYLTIVDVSAYFPPVAPPKGGSSALQLFAKMLMG